MQINQRWRNLCPRWNEQRARTSRPCKNLESVDALFDDTYNQPEWYKVQYIAMLSQHCNTVVPTFLLNVEIQPNYNIQALLCGHCVNIGANREIQLNPNVQATYCECWCTKLKSNLNTISRQRCTRMSSDQNNSHIKIGIRCAIQAQLQYQ